MKVLSTTEKKEHVSKLTQFINKIKPNIPYLASSNLILKQICYIVPLDSEEFYFDYPYNQFAEKFNADLNNSHCQVQEASEKALALFKKFQAHTNIHPFIYYKYYLAEDQSVFYVHDLKTNINVATQEDRNTILGYLPIVHQGSYLEHENTHNANVVESKETTGAYNELLTLYWPINLDNKFANNTSIACSLEVQPGFKITNDFEFEDIFYYINQYFNSPVLTKIINDKKISEILVYQHSFKNLGLSDTLDVIDKLSKHFNTEEKSEWIKARNKITAWRFFSDILIKIEQIDNNLGNPAIHPKLSQGIGVLLSFYADELNYFGISTEISLAPDINSITLPTGKKLYDLALVIWNVMENAWKESYKKGSNKINIEVNINIKKIHIKFTNRGKMPSELVAYCYGLANYPRIDTTGINPLRGLQIIRTKCENYNWELSINTDKLDTTELFITF